MTTDLVNLLSAQSGQWHSLRGIQDITGLSVNQILDQIELLRKSGYWIEMSPALGCRLHPRGSLVYDQIVSGIRAQRLGRRLLVYQETNSTNDVVWSYAAEVAADRMDYDGLVVFADHQRKGRGRLGRSWYCEPGTALMGSILIYSPPDSMMNASALSVAAGVCTAQAIDEVCQIHSQIKWPNDVMWQEMKLAGIMVESRKIGSIRVFVVGIGINCSLTNQQLPPELIGRAISLQQITGSIVNREQLAVELVNRLDQFVESLSGGKEGHDQVVKTLHEIWAQKCVNLGNPITVIWNGKEFSGRVADIDIDKGLLLQLDNGGIRLFDASTTTVKIA